METRSTMTIYYIDKDVNRKRVNNNNTTGTCQDISIKPLLLKTDLYWFFFFSYIFVNKKYRKLNKHINDFSSGK